MLDFIKPPQNSQKPNPKIFYWIVGAWNRINNILNKSKIFDLNNLEIWEISNQIIEESQREKRWYEQMKQIYSLEEIEKKPELKWEIDLYFHNLKLWQEEYKKAYRAQFLEKKFPIQFVKKYNDIIFFKDEKNLFYVKLSWSKRLFKLWKLKNEYIKSANLSLNGELIIDFT